MYKPMRFEIIVGKPGKAKSEPAADLGFQDCNGTPHFLWGQKDLNTGSQVHSCSKNTRKDSLKDQIKSLF